MFVGNFGKQNLKIRRNKDAPKKAIQWETQEKTAPRKKRKTSSQNW